MDEINEELSDLQSKVTHMRVKVKDAIINRENQNTDMELDILKRTKIIPVYKMKEIAIPDLKITNDLIDSSFTDTEVKIGDLKDKVTELKKLMKIVKQQQNCAILKFQK